MNLAKYKVNGKELELVQGDITQARADAIVNAANSSLMGGGGVDGAIHRSAGPRLLESCKEIVNKQGKLPAGQAVITPGFDLTASYVIHTVGPIWRGGSENEEDILQAAYANCLDIAASYDLKEVAFPAISCGAYGFPLQKAVPIALNALKNGLEQKKVEKVAIYLFSATDWQKWKDVADELLTAK